jgi:5-methylcytosine-specific restriction endonuclease McrA
MYSDKSKLSDEEKRIRADLRRKRKILLVDNRRRRKKQVGGSYTLEQWEALKEEFNNRCANCGKQKTLEADHIVPVSHWSTFFGDWVALGLIKYQCNDIENIQPLCRDCNVQKSDMFSTEDGFIRLNKAA